jgi:hypothetical protein
MYKPLTKKDQKRVLSMFNKKTKDAKKIAETLHIPRHSIMQFFEETGRRFYSPGTYC